MSSDLLTRLKKVSTNCESADKSEFLNQVEQIKTKVPALNVALSGELTGGIYAGSTLVAGPSKHYKSNLTLLMVSSYLKEHEDAIAIFYDNEYGITKDYMNSFGIDPSRVLHTPFRTVEELKSLAVNQINQINRGDKVIIFIDSIGNAASAKEIRDAEDGNDKADMTRAKAVKSFWRIICPMVKVSNIPLIAIAHTYKTMDLFPSDQVGGGTGNMYSPDSVFIMQREQIKESNEVVGWKFKIKIEKSRFIKEKSVIPLEVSYKGGVSPLSALLEWGLESGYIDKVTKQSVCLIHPDTGEVVEDKVSTKNIPVSYWKVLIKSENFQNFVRDKFKLPDISLDTIEEFDIL